MGLKEFAKRVNYTNKDGKIIGVYDAHNKIYDSLDNNRFVQIVSSRQVGLTNILANYCANFLVNNSGEYNVMYFGSPNNELRRQFFKLVSDKLRNYYGKAVYRDFIDVDKYDEIVVNGNKLLPFSDTNINKERLYGVVFDNFQFIHKADSLYRDIICLISSVPECRLVIGGKTPSYSPLFNLMTIHWSEIKRFDSDFYEDMVARIGAKAFNNEYNDMSPEYSSKQSKLRDRTLKNKTIQIRLDEDMYQEIGLKLVDSDLTLSDYVRSLIKSDLNSENN